MEVSTLATRPFFRSPSGESARSAASGLRIAALAWRDLLSTLGDQRWFPIGTGVACLAATLLLSLLVLAKDRREVQTSAAAVAVSIAGQIQGNVNGSVLAVTRMARRLERVEDPSETDWEADADNYLKDIPGLVALTRLDADSVVRWHVPRTHNPQFLGTVLNEDPVRRRILEATNNANGTRISPTMELYGGGTGILMVSRIHRADEYGGYLVAVFDHGGLWRSLLVDASEKGYRIEVLEGTRRLYETMPASAGNPQPVAESVAQLPGVVWTVRAQPPPETFLAGSQLFVAILIGGAVVSLLLALSIAFAQSSSRRARESELVKGQLESEIRERQKYEEVVSQNEERFRRAFGNAPIGMALVTREGRWLRVNDSVCRMLGYSEAELLTTDFQSLTHPDDLTADLELASRLRAGEIETYSLDKRYFHRSGRIVHASLHVSFVGDKPGRPGYFVSQIMDISQRVEMDRLKREFISTVSHELRTPLTSIAGSLGLMAGGVAGELPAAAQQLVEIAERNSCRLVRLIDDILYIDKAAAGQLRFERELQPLAPIVRQALEANREYAAGFNVDLELLAAQTDALVRVDRDRLIQVLTNLISNAAKFSPSGSSVSIEMKVRNGRVQVSVTDRGPGIPEAFRSRIFQQFAQADNPDIRNRGGTGLGLSIAKVFMERLGGTIDFTTAEGAGSTFSIYLPCEALT